jgi:hypothetical protein
MKTLTMYFTDGKAESGVIEFARAPNGGVDNSIQVWQWGLLHMWRIRLDRIFKFGGAFCGGNGRS